MGPMERFTESLTLAIVFVSPLLNIYLMVRLATTKRGKLLKTAIGLGLYVLFLFLIASVFFTNP